MNFVPTPESVSYTHLDVYKRQELHTALEQAEELYLNAARRLFRMLKAGSQMQETK